jgi:hypothetical protein
VSFKSYMRVSKAEWSPFQTFVFVRIGGVLFCKEEEGAGCQITHIT